MNTSKTTVTFSYSALVWAIICTVIAYTAIGKPAPAGPYGATILFSLLCYIATFFILYVKLPEAPNEFKPWYNKYQFLPLIVSAVFAVLIVLCIFLSTTRKELPFMPTFAPVVCWLPYLNLGVSFVYVFLFLVPLKGADNVEFMGEKNENEKQIKYN